MTMYHREQYQEGFLVLRGECLLIVEGREVPLRPWDYFHCPADVAHAIVGSGDGPSLVLAVGSRVGPEVILYERDETALGARRRRRAGDGAPERGVRPLHAARAGHAVPRRVPGWVRHPSSGVAHRPR